MVLRPSLGRVGPGSVPPWRALCAESARALKAFLLARFLGQGLLPAWAAGSGAPPQLLWPSGRASVQRPDVRGRAQRHRGAKLMGAFVTWRTASLNHRCSPTKGASEPSTLGPCGWPRARFLPRVFCGLDPGCRAMFFVATPWFSTSGNQKGGGRSFSVGSLSIFAIETLLALHGAECCNSAKRELEIIAEPLRLRHEALLSGRSFLAPCAQKLATTPALATYCYCLVRCSPIFAICHLLRWSRCASPLCFRCVRFVDLRWCGSWPLVAGLGGWD